MESFFVRYKNVLVLVAVLLAQTIALAVQVRRPVEAGAPDAPQVRLIRLWVVAAVTPFERVSHAIGLDTRKGWTNYIDLRHTKQQNAELKNEIAQLRLEQASMAEDAIQGHRLQALLDFKEHYISSTVAAQVVGTSGSDLSHVIYIDKGSDDGLRTDMAVITPDGVVGKTRDVFPHTSQVLLISDQTSGAGVVLEATRVSAILHGSSTGVLEITNLTPDSRIKPGEQVVTSGGDQIFPRGLPVGTITSVALDPDHPPYSLIQLKPAANLTQLEEVLVITGTQTELPDQARKDMAVGAATAKAEEAAKAAKAAQDQAAAQAAASSAAQIVASRLPSLNDNNGTNGQTQTAPGTTPAGPPGGIVPVPPPAIHPDRYTPGATPPAADLTPGAKTNVIETPPASSSTTNSTANPTDTTTNPTNLTNPAHGTAPAKTRAPKSTDANPNE
ncbi:hypothetical protein GCM10011507_28160 [Edaphobacter acidisoli]|uniref:Cell shape-determining protein MreC n=1 Tax=Edaphobacter acidisoli TaxID=2040573 RepID=A0A916W7X5_9BACT|nr:rod shape-determining protein MreC [Edaphobacter acidisoli]GGA75139.1 hypothetical protein GCM10011507_28160 [Edaphobacter acidisoli]